MLLEECKKMNPDLLLGVIRTVPALPLSRSLSIQMDLVHQLALLADQCGAVVCLQCRDAHGYDQLIVRQS
eukprot:12908167-Prorocentrum_lima.AAC.1